MNKTEDQNTLDRVLALLMSAMSSLQVKNEEIMPFDIHSHFAPSQKNETQLKFPKKPARQKKKKKLEYIHL